MTKQISDEERERRRLYGIEYRKQNRERLKALHNERLKSDSGYAERYRKKQEKRRKINQPGYAEAIKAKDDRRNKLAIARAERERIRHQTAKSKMRLEKRDEYNAYMREYNKRNRDEINSKRRERWNGDLMYRSKQFYSKVKSSYGLSQEQYADLYLEHNGRCQICMKSEVECIRGLSVDHCHAKGNVRGLLCAECNTSLGNFKDNVELLRNAIKYLERN